MDTASSRTFLYDFGKARFLAACAALGVLTPEVRFAGATAPGTSDQPAHDRYWARISRRVVDERQEGLRNGALLRRFVSDGLVFVQLFAPVTDSRAQDNLDKLAERIRNDFRTFQGVECEFTSAAINDSVAREQAWLRANVVSNYQFRQFI